MAAHIYELPASLTTLRPDMPAELDKLVLRCLAKAPAERFASIQDLDDALDRCRTIGEWTEAEASHWWDSLAGSEPETGLSGDRKS